MIQDHLTNPELSQKLKELGVPQESEFYWSEEGKLIYKKERDVLVRHLGAAIEKYLYSAFLASELLEMMPTYQGCHLVATAEYRRGWISFYEADSMCDDDFPARPKRQTNEANARAELLIYLIQQGLVSFNGIGKRKGNE
jgi:hypothetical protein